MKTLLAMLAVLSITGCAGSGAGPVGPDKVVYHLGEGLDQASNGLRNIRNHLEVNPKAHIVVVAHAQGVDYLFKDAKDKNGNSYEVAVQDLKRQGKARSIGVSTALPDVTNLIKMGVFDALTPGGVNKNR